MSYTDILYRLPNELIKLFRSFGQTKEKEINAKWSIVFNETCIKENYLIQILMIINNKYINILLLFN